MEKTTIQVDRNIPKSILIGFLLSFVTVFALEHFSTFSYIPNLNISNTDINGKIIMRGTYDPFTTPLATLSQITPFGTKIDLPTDGMMCSELIVEGSDFKSYSKKGVLFVKAVFNDYKYFLLFGLAYSLIILFFKRYRLKVMILILPVCVLSCDKTKEELTIYPKKPIESVKINSNNNNIETIQKAKQTAVKHTFVVFQVKDKYFGEESVIVTGIFSTPNNINADEEYIILDDAQTKCHAYLFDKNITERYLMRFDSYAEASKEKERISKIRNSTAEYNQKSTPKVLTKEEQEQIIREWKSITPEEHEEARRLQMDYEIWAEEQKRNQNNY